jgi:hypothetical protein
MDSFVNRLALIRQRRHTGHPLVNAALIQSLETAVQRRLTLQKRGPDENIVTGRRHGELTFDLLAGSVFPNYQSRLRTKF